MTDVPTPEPSTRHDGDVPTYPGIPRWVKLFAIGVTVLVLLLVAMALFSGGQHIPGSAGGNVFHSSLAQSAGTGSLSWS
jgi:hypothetical protein